MTKEPGKKMFLEVPYNMIRCIAGKRTGDKKCGENKIKFTTFENKWIYTLLITDNVDNPIDIIEITERETEAYKSLLYNF